MAPRTREEEETWDLLKSKVTVLYQQGQSRQWLSRKTTELLEQVASPDSDKKGYLGGIITVKEQEDAIKEIVSRNAVTQQLGWARDASDLPTAPPYLPYTPMPGIFSSPYCTMQNNVKDLRVFLQRGGYNWPQNIGDNRANDWANIAGAANFSEFVYKHIDTPKARIKRIHISGSYSQIAYNPLNSVTEAAAFFADNSGYWNIEYLTASTLRYNVPAEPNTYPNNRLVYWNNTAKLTAASTHFYRSRESNQYGTSPATTPAEENIFNWIVELPKGVILDTNDTIKLITGYATTVNGMAQFDKMYVALDLEIVDFDFNYLEISRTFSILVTLAATDESQENLTENVTKKLKKPKK